MHSQTLRVSRRRGRGLKKAAARTGQSSGPDARSAWGQDPDRPHPALGIPSTCTYARLPQSHLALWEEIQAESLFGGFQKGNPKRLTCLFPAESCHFLWSSFAVEMHVIWAEQTHNDTHALQGRGERELAHNSHFKAHLQRHHAFGDLKKQQEEIGKLTLSGSTS